MSAIEHTYGRIMAYLKDLLSNRQRHDLEKEMMQDVFDEEAFEGINQLSASELESDMSVLMDKLNNRIAPVKRKNLLIIYRIAAGILLMVGIAGLLFVLLRTPAPKPVAERYNPQKQITPSAPLPPQVKDSEKSPKQKAADGFHTPEQSFPLQAENRKESDELISEMKPAAGVEVRITDKSTVPALATKAKSDITIRGIASGAQVSNIITGKVVGIDGEALPGVAVFEKGTSRGTLSDSEGKFSLQIEDTGSKIDLNYIGYQPVELKAGELAGSVVTMQEDLLALDEVVVVGYGTQKKNDVTGAVSRLESKDLTPVRETDAVSLINPVPPGGTLKAFKNWVNERIDSSGFRTYPGKYRIQVVLTIQSSGYFSNIQVRGKVPSPIADEYKRVIALSPVWKPATKNDEAVDSEVVIRFAITVE